jgi:septal ring factor EnvC (AmiA/AmiB activator)
MTEKPKPESSLGNDVQVIRNILLGEHLDKFQKQVDALEKEVGVLKKENKALLKELETGNEKRFQELIARLEELSAKQDRFDKDFDSELQKIRTRLSAYEDNQGGLIASLANALLEYKNKSGK